MTLTATVANIAAAATAAMDPKIADTVWTVMLNAATRRIDVAAMAATVKVVDGVMMTEDPAN